MHSPGLTIAEICVQKGIKHAVISPGSRSAQVTVALARHEDITTHIGIDERSAAYLAMGIAQQTGTTAALVCTSGTAVLNYGPAVAEAYYQNIPLLVITADRPPEWIDQQDGQALVQPGVYGRHAKRCFNLPVDTDNKDGLWHFTRQISEAINLAGQQPQGPVQLNVPIREPFYDSLLSDRAEAARFRIIEESTAHLDLHESEKEKLTEAVSNAQRIVVLAGQQPYSEEIRSLLDQIAATGKVVVVADILANLHGIPTIISRADSLFANDKLRPDSSIDLLISFGQSILSKHLKNFLRNADITDHYHIQPHGDVADSFKQLSRIVRCSPETFIKEVLGPGLSETSLTPDKDKAFLAKWRSFGTLSHELVDDFFNSKDISVAQRGEFQVVHRLVRSLPENSVLHLSNSMPVRYANLAGLEESSVEIFSNRGTSGIDGCMSTAMGHAIADPSRKHFLIIGDTTFFYDRNALLGREKLPPNLTIMVMNNNGGGIFNLIEGAGSLPEVDDYFVCSHDQRAGHVAKEVGLAYCCYEGEFSLDDLAEVFTTTDHPALFEIITDREANKNIFTEYRAFCSSLKPE